MHYPANLQSRIFYWQIRTMENKITSFDNIKINYEINRVCDFFIIFLHGLGEDHNIWKDEIRFFNKKGISTLAVDLRGHGLSDKPKTLESWKLEYLADDVHRIVINEKIGQCIIVGFSYGGMIAIKFHKMFPKLALGYVLISTSYKTPNTYREINKFSFVRKIVNYLNTRLSDTYFSKKKTFTQADYKKEIGKNERNLVRIYIDLSKTSVKSMLFALENIDHFREINTLKSIKEPTLIISGEKDSFFDPDLERRMNKLIPNSEIDLLPEATHMVAINYKTRLEEDIYSFIKKNEKCFGLRNLK